VTELETPKVQGVELVRFDWRAEKAKDGHDERAVFLARKMKLADAKSYSPKWARVMYRKIYGRWPGESVLAKARRLLAEGGVRAG